MARGFTKNDDYGPSWFDVYEALKRIRGEAGPKLELTIESSTSVSGKFGIYVSVRHQNCSTILGACGYGPAFPAGAKNVPTACFRALLQAEDNPHTAGGSCTGCGDLQLSGKMSE